jgi:hypothetical protein
LKSSILFSVKLSFHNSSCRVSTDTAYNTSALTSLDDGSGEKERVLLVLIHVFVLLHELSFSIFNSWFIHLEVLSFNDECISWNTGTCLKKDNITDNDVPNADALSCAEFASNDWNILLFDVFGELNVLLIFQVISNSDNGDQKDGNQDDGDSLPNRFPFCKAQGNYTGKESSSSDGNPKDILDGLANGLTDTGCWWLGSQVFTEDFPSSLEVLFVTHDTSVLLRGKLLEDAFCLAVLFKQFVVVTGLFGLPEEISVKIWKTVSNRYETSANLLKIPASQPLDSCSFPERRESSENLKS